MPHRFLLAGISLVPLPEVPAGLADGVFADTWAVMDGRLPPGWRATPFDPWMVRPPGRAEGPAVPGLVIEPTEDALRFERIAFLGASGRPPDVPGELHPPGSASFPGLRLLLAVLDGRDVGSAIAVSHDTGVVVSGVAVLAVARRRGIGAALTAAACASAPHKPATLCASDLGLGVYRRLGFVEVGRPLHWFPPAHPHYPTATS